MQQENISGAQAVISSLLCEGVETIFGYPGGAIMPIYDALYDKMEEVNHILVRHEQGAIHAAQGFARASGKVGVVFATSGPGATNLITGLADAYIDSTPVLCIIGQVASKLIGTDAFQETDVIGISMPITKWNYQVTKASEIAPTIAKAFYLAKSGRPGPVVIDITKDAQFGMTDFSYKSCVEVRSYAPLPKPDLADFIKAADLINKAKKPYLLVGQGVLLAHAEKELKTFVEKADIPTASTLLGLGALSSDHSHFCGMLGMHGDYAANMKTNECDVLIAIGMRFDDRVTGDVSRYAKQAKVIHIDIDAAELNKIVKADVGIQSDAKEALSTLCGLIEVNTHTAWLDEFKQGKQYEQKQLETHKQGYNSDKIMMEDAVKMLTELTKGEVVVVTDVGQHQMITARNYQYNKHKTNITSGGLGTMGFALPAAIGAKLGNPKQTVVAIAGDAGFQMNIQELGTIMQSSIDVKIIILNNSFLGMVRQWQQMFFEKRYSFTEMNNPNFIGIAQSYNIQAKRIDQSQDLRGALKEMLAYQGAYLLEIVVEKEENVFPMIPTGASVSEVLLS
ncbi:biosynthetic-type acetolactate synthase large subunit [Myroides marinus]|uniref:biosynthetic-type acetolactate synthase large subunit n=1 Tax=Myroides marinus TaxID=703342 RepID=UPI002575BD7A|nr:biosynthetic-type acetolactate synthase large subunit [Myroides marinus]MDM1346856.1 biosynthetic-type acetolactate synthase large subunit [Myroides marinus]MDM1370798.1 biosynthetic-type acetolactate synthase large subunit [Myroides marinus]MDM1531867.1 biosynthetic-type acetolactate synthase large subunit [Myroides marinus]MDM1538709.1 biosynthetic-type acetolactate synthase large subunit [Myroides marinus]